MARQKRIDFPGAWHHVMSRGRRSSPIFERDEDCELFLETVGGAVERFGVEVHCYSLMPNHYHLLVHTPRGDLSRAMARVNGLYTQRVNRRHGWEGAVFRGRFHSVLVQDDVHRRALFAYIHLNPVKANLVMDLHDPAWTSHRALVGLDRPPAWLSTWAAPLLFGSPTGLDEAVHRFHSGKQAWPDFFDPTTGRWDRPVPADLFPVNPPDTLAAIATVVAAVEKVTGVSLEELRQAPRGRGANPARRFAALVLCQRTGATHREIGAALSMTVQQVGNVVHQEKQRRPTDRVTGWLVDLDALLG